MRFVFFVKKNYIFKSKQENIYSISSLLSSEEINTCIEEAYRSSSCWDMEQQTIIIFGKNIIKSAQLYVYNYIYDLLIAEKVLLKLNNIKKKEIYLNGDKALFENLMLVNSFYNFDFVIEDSFSENEKLSLKYKVKTFLKDNFLDNFVKYIFSFKNSTSITQKEILIFADVYNKPTNENLNLIFKNLSEKIETEIVSSEFRIKNDFFNGKGRLLGNFVNYKTFMEYIKEKNLLEKQLNTFRVIINSSKNENLNRSIGRMLEKNLKKFYLTCILDSILIKNMYNKVKPKVLIIGTDCHKLSRQAAILSKGEIHSLVIQHGATNGIHGFAPLFAEKIAVWGEISRDVLISWGVNPASIEVTGNPRYDRLKEFKNNNQNQNINKVLVALSPYDKKTQEEILELICEALEIQPETEVIIKPHPSDNNIDVYETLLNKRRHLNIKIDSKTAIENIFNGVKAVISAQSTIGIEALINNKNLIEINHPRIPRKIPYDQYNCSFLVNDKHDLINALFSINNNDNICKSKSRNAEKFLAHYVGPLKGSSIEKIQAIINKWI